MHQGRRHGRGILFLCNTDEYEGQFENGKRNGYGVYIDHNNPTGTSPNTNSKTPYHEKDIMSFNPHGDALSAYKGEWKDDARHGYGE
jgi:hypothetical protein